MATEWQLAGNLKGPPGQQGVPGTPGAPGSTTLRGATDYDNATAPVDGEAILWVAAGGGKFAPRKVLTPDANGRLQRINAPIVPTLVREGTVSSFVTSDAGTGGGNLINIAVTGDITVNALTNPTDFQEVRHHFVATGADRQVTFAGGYLASSRASLGPYVVPRGKVLATTSEYVGNRNTNADADAPAWVLLDAALVDSLPPAAPDLSVYELKANRGVASGYGTLDVAGKQPIGELAAHSHYASSILAPPTLVTGATGTVTPTAGDINRKIAYTATGNLTINAPSGTPPDGLQLLIEVYAPTTARTVTFAAPTTGFGGLSLGPHTVPIDKVGLFGLYYSARAAHFMLVAAGTE